MVFPSLSSCLICEICVIYSLAAVVVVVVVGKDEQENVMKNE